MQELNNQASQPDNPYLGEVSYAMVEKLSFKCGIPFNVAQNIINHDRRKAGLPLICYEEKPANEHSYGGIWADPNIKINIRG